MKFVVSIHKDEDGMYIAECPLNSGLRQPVQLRKLPTPDGYMQRSIMNQTTRTVSLFTQSSASKVYL